MNFMNANHHEVGGHANSVQILEAVGSACAAKPLTPLIQVVNEVYREFEKAGR